MTYKKGGKSHRFKLGNNEIDMLYEISAGDIFIGFLLSGASSRHMYKVARERAKVRYAKKRAFQSMCKKGLIHTRGKRVLLTKLGERIIQQHKITNILRNNKRKWDGKWRVVSFDIPNEMSHVRTALRILLNDAGFLKVQQSVYVYPHECKQLLDFINSEKQFGKYITFMVAEYANNTERWKKELKHLIA